MKIIVQKYGGTSVANISKIKKIASNIKSLKKDKLNLVIVVSAMAGETDKLLNLINSISKIPNGKEYDNIISTGERVSSSLLAMALMEINVNAITLGPEKINILTTNTHMKATIQSVDTKEIKKFLKKDYVVIIPGFQGINNNRDVTTLGRGGSDLSAVAIAGAINAEKCELLKDDVDGIYTTDPSLYKRAKKINYISYQEMLEMSSLGSKVLQSKAVELANKLDIKLNVRSTFNLEKKGTIVMNEKEIPTKEKKIVSGITHDLKQAKISIIGIKDTPGIASKIFKPIGEAGIVVDMIVQNISTQGETDLTFTVPKEDVNKTVKILKENKSKLTYSDLIKDEKIALISIVGAGMKIYTGVATRMFTALAKAKINITMISTSEIKISCVINKSACKKAIKGLHREFNLG
tara:strand:+ start:593 stop:1816 length:1224 start_codon:yes stop_codon:yes gene_type:complete